jgi:hypothetical protein
MAMQDRAKLRPWLLWLGVGFLVTFNFPAPSVQSSAFSDASAAYAQSPKPEKFRAPAYRAEKS